MIFFIDTKLEIRNKTGMRFMMETEKMLTKKKKKKRMMMMKMMLTII